MTGAGDATKVVRSRLFTGPAMTDLPARLEKLRFIIAELQLSFAVSEAAPSSWEARLAARHVLVRACDFIAHARQVRKLVRPFGAEPAFNEKKETYAAWFDEYFGTLRDRLGAHVQDLDFGLRIELWNGMDVNKIGFFVEGAVETYNALAAFNIPGFVALPNAPAELTNPAFLAKLDQFRASGSEPRAEFASDPLGMTRPGTSSGSGMTPVHDRASQLTLIARWVEWDLAMLERFTGFLHTRRILLSRLVTDVLSYADCLVTRPVLPGAPQAMPGFNDLMASEREGPSPAFASFLAGYRFRAVAEGFRPLRNEAGGHLDISPTVSIAGICARLDAVDVEDLTTFFRTMRNLFTAACMERNYLKIYLADGHPIRGGVPVQLDSVKHYGGTQADPQPELVPVHKWERGDIEAAIARALSDGEVAADAAVASLLEALRQQRGDQFGVVREGEGWMKRDTHHFTLAHQVVLDALLVAREPETVAGLFELLRLSGRNWSSTAAETLIRYRDAGGHFAETPAFIRVLAAVMNTDAARFADPVRSAAWVGRPWPMRREAVIGLFRAHIREEGLRRINDRQDFIDLNADMAPFLVGFSRQQEIELLMAMTSVVWDYDLSLMASKFDADLALMRQRLLDAVTAELLATGRPDDVELAKRLIDQAGMAGLALHMALPSDGAEYADLLEATRAGYIFVGQDEASAGNLINCFWLLKDKQSALAVATRLAQRSPSDAGRELLRLEVMSNISGNRSQVLAGAARLRRDFTLTAEQDGRVAALIADPEP